MITKMIGLIPSKELICTTVWCWPEGRQKGLVEGRRRGHEDFGNSVNSKKKKKKKEVGI